MTVDEMIKDGWRPAKTVSRLWVKGQTVEHDEHDRDVVSETWDEAMDMTIAEEAELITFNWSEIK